MGIYDPLKEYLSLSSQSSIRLTFSEIEKILNHTLPKSAYTYKAWWANGGHSQADAWIDAGYKVTDVDFTEKAVSFSKDDSHAKKTSKRLKPVVNKIPTNVPTFKTDNMDVCGYTFSFLQDLVPKCGADGKAIKYYPQDDYDNKSGLGLHSHGKGAFCRFNIKADNWAGVYLWILDGEIIYIGETAGLQQRFNTGYGNISPRNCYVGGQSTNCKMNKVVLDNFERGKVVSLYFYQTTDYKRVELELLNKIQTPYNIKDNQ